MAVVTAINPPIKNETHMLNSIEYMTAPNNFEKTFDSYYSECFGSASDIVQEFRNVRMAHNKNSGILAHHYVQSFEVGTVTARQAFEIGKEYLQKVIPAGFSFVMSTHIDKGHIRNHFIINSVNAVTGQKWLSQQATLKYLRNENDKICRKYALKVLEPKQGSRGIDQATYHLAKNGKSWKVNLTKDLDEALEACKSKKEFTAFLKERGYTVRFREKSVLIRKDGEKRGITLKTLSKQFGEKYGEENLYRVIGGAVIERPAESTVRSDSKSSENFKSGVKRNFSQTQERNPWRDFERHLFKNRKRENTVNEKQLTEAMKNWQKISRKNRILYFRSRVKGNTGYYDIDGIPGENYSIKLLPCDISKLFGQPFLYSMILTADKEILVTVKAYNKERLLSLLNYKNVAFYSRQEEENANYRLYRELKAQAASKGEKLCYRIVDKSSLERLKNSEIKFACFPKSEGKFNIAYLKQDSGKVYRAAAVSKTNLKIIQ